MIHRPMHWSPTLCVAIVVATSQGACGDNGSSAGTAGGNSFSSGSAGGSNAGGSGGTAGSGGGFAVSSGAAGAGGATDKLEVEPSALQTITVKAGQTTPTVAYDATLNGQPIKAG